MILMPLTLLGLGLGALFLGERTLHGSARLAALGLAAACLAAALAAAGGRWLRARGPRRRAQARALGAYLTVGAGLGAYALWAYAPAATALGGPHAHAALTALWPALLALGVVPAVAIDLAVASMAAAPAPELWRVALAARSARVLVLGGIAFAGANYAAAQWPHKIDLSYFKTTRVGTATRALAAGLTAPVTLTLFFPPGSEVLAQVRPYVDELAAASPQIKVEVLDQALAPARARALKVRANGTLVVASDHAAESLRLDLDAEAARQTLRALDREVHRRLLKVIRPERIAYFTVGHMERDLAPTGDDVRPGLGSLKALLTAENVTTRRLGLAEGLGDAVPRDATLVVVAGPTEALGAAERASLAAYLAGGGRALIALDPEHGGTEDALLAPLGVRVGRHLVATDRYRVRVPGRGESPYDMVTVRAGTHPIATTLAQNAGRLALAVLGAGKVTPLNPLPPGVRVQVAVHAMQGAWEDLDGNGRHDPATEPTLALGLVAACEGIAPPAPAPAAGTDARADAGAGGTAEGKADAEPDARADDAAGGAATGTRPTPPRPLRAVVAGDADWLADGVLQNPGNAYFMVDVLRWLIGEDAPGLAVESEEDVALTHRKEDDVVWFYGVSVLVPLAVLAAGLAFARRGGNRPTRPGDADAAGRARAGGG